MAEESEAVGSVQVQVTKRFDAPAEKVFDAWLNAERLGLWMFGPSVRDEAIVHLKVDARVGGKFSFLVKRQEMLIDHVGTYRIIDQPRRLVFTWGIARDSEEESVVTIEIEPEGDVCALSLTHEMAAKWAAYADRTKAGWKTMLDALGRALA